MSESPRNDGGNDATFITFQDAYREFGVYPSTIRAWQRTGLIDPKYIVNLVIQRGALMRAINAAKGPGDSDEPVVRPGLPEIELARRILDICTSDSDTAAKLRVMESVVRSVLDRVP